MHLWGFRRAGCEGVQLSSAILQAGRGASSARRACSITCFSSVFQSPCTPKTLKHLSQLRSRLILAPSKKKKIKKINPPRWLEAGSQRGRAALPAAWSCPQPAPARPRDLRLQPWGRVKGRRERGPAAGGSPRRAANPLSVLQGAPRGALPSSCWCCWCWAHGQRRRRRVSAGSRDTVTVPARVPGGGVGSAGEEEEEEGGIFC